MEIEKDGTSLLSEQDCWELLRSQRVGRVAFTVNALPAILPVRYRLMDWFVVFFTDVELTLFKAMANAVIAFGVDEVSADAEPVWSVTAVGQSYSVTEEGVLDDIRGDWQLDVPAGSRLMAFRPDFISGRRFVATNSGGDG